MHRTVYRAACERSCCALGNLCSSVCPRYAGCLLMTSFHLLICTTAAAVGPLIFCYRCGLTGAARRQIEDDRDAEADLAPGLRPVVGSRRALQERHRRWFDEQDERRPSGRFSGYDADWYTARAQQEQQPQKSASAQQPPGRGGGGAKGNGGGGDGGRSPAR